MFFNYELFVNQFANLIEQAFNIFAMKEFSFRVIKLRMQLKTQEAEGVNLLYPLDSSVEDILMNILCK